MPLRTDILEPIPGENPGGADLRYDTKLLIYDTIREARRKDDDLAQGAWQHERKVANYPLVIKLAQDAIASKSKDLQLAAWLTEALLNVEGFAGLRQGLALFEALLTNFWESAYPLIEDGDRELRAKPLAWVGSNLELAVKSAPLVNEGYDWLTYIDSRAVGYEDSPKTDKDKKTRAKMIADGKLTPELFDKAFVATPKAFYVSLEREVDACLALCGSLNKICDDLFEDDAPALSKLENALTQVRHTVHTLLDKKRETEPDPPEPTAPPDDADLPVASSEETFAVAAASSSATFTLAEPADRRQAVAAVASAAAYLRRLDPLSPAPYLMIRGMRWGELYGVPRLAGSNLLEAPSTELRQQIKRLAINSQWRDLLDAAEAAMTQPASRAWLDLQRMVVGACTALGPEYEPIATAIRSALRALLNDLPDLLDATLLDDTPAANPETRSWLQDLSEPVLHTAPAAEAGDVPLLQGSPNGQVSWLSRAADPYALAKEALKAGKEEKAFLIMRNEIVRQTSGRGRFARTMQLVELCSVAGRDAIAQPLLEDMAAAIETHKLDAWEDPKMVASALTTLMKTSKKIQASAGDKQKLFERICRLDPVQALGGV